MELDADLFRRIAGDIALQLPADDPSERRCDGRVWLGRHTQVLRGTDPGNPGDATCLGVVIRDLSPRGVAILSTTEIAVGERFVLVLPLALARRAGDEPLPWVTVEYRTLRCEADGLGAGVFVIAAEFVRMNG
jgi:hypothetical protein